MASITVRLVAGRKIRARRLCIPQSRLPQPLSGNTAAGAGTEGWKRAPLVASSLSAMGGVS